MVLKFLSLNTKGLTSPYKRRALWKEAENHSCDVLCVKEMHFLATKPPGCKHIFQANFKKKKRGVMVAIRDSISFRLHASLIDDKGRYIILIVELNGTLCTLVNIYAPNRHQIRFIRRTLTRARSIQKGQLLICGDFNIIIPASGETP